MKDKISDKSSYYALQQMFYRGELLEEQVLEILHDAGDKTSLSRTKAALTLMLEEEKFIERTIKIKSKLLTLRQAIAAQQQIVERKKKRGKGP